MRERWCFMQPIIGYGSREAHGLRSVLAAALAVLLAVAFAGFPAAALAWGSERSSEGGAPQESMAVQTVYVYVQATGEASARMADSSDAGANEHGYYTIGTMQMTLPSATAGLSVEVSDYASAISAALDSLVRFEANRQIDLTDVRWSKLAVSAGATDYPDAPALAWHLDGVMTVPEQPVVPPAPVDPEPDPMPEPTPDPELAPTPDPAPESPAVGEDPALGNEGVSSDGNEAAGAQRPATTPSGSQAVLPSSGNDAPAATDPPRSDAETASSRNRGADAAPAIALPTTAVTPSAPAEASVVADDVTPLAPRIGEAIGEEEVPLGAFDEPVDPTPWVAGMGATAVALVAAVAVRRRLLMASRLQTFEDSVLGMAPDAHANEAAPHSAYAPTR